jgi:hypothetical protein
MDKMKFAWAVSGSLLLVIACKKNAIKTEQPKLYDQALENKGQSMSDIHSRLIGAVTGSDSNTIREMMSPSILCCNEGEGPDACISYFFPENSERGKSYQSKLANVINSGYSISAIQDDSLARYPKIYPPQNGESGYSSNSEDYASGYHEYVTDKAIVVYDSADVTSESRELTGSRYVKRLNRINCKDYDKVWDIDCEWQKSKRPRTTPVG